MKLEKKYIHVQICMHIHIKLVSLPPICWLIAGKEKLSEVDLQLKKAEAAQRRRMQSEKMAREAEVCPSCYVVY